MGPRSLPALLVLATTTTMTAAAPPVTTHPRLWLRDTDVARLRAWANPTNPVWQDGLRVMASRAKADMDAGHVPAEDGGSFHYEPYPCEVYAETFAFMSLVDPDPAARVDWAARARTVLMYVIDRAALGAAPGEPFRDPKFSTGMRALFYGEAFALTVDWIYPTLTAGDKAKIRDVFIRWIEENKVATTTTNNHPVPVGVENDPILISDPTLVRWSSNNFYENHMRNIGLMAMALDAGDDPGGVLAAYLGNATGAWLYVVDHMLRTHAAGGLHPEGSGYGAQALGYTAQLMHALRTAGQDDPSRWGPQVVLDGNPYWSQLLPAHVNELSPVPAILWAWQGPVYVPAWYADGDKVWSAYWVSLFASLGLHAERGGNKARYDACRWLLIHGEPGGQAELIDRIANSLTFVGSGRDAILYFMMLDPGLPAPADPRPAMPMTVLAPGLGRILARTGWDGNASWFTYKLSWNDTDHQHGDGNMFELYRKGEWLTKERTGYGVDIGCSDYHNTLALENDEPAQNCPGCIQDINWRRGSQWAYSGGDPVLLARSVTRTYAYALGDATNLYNSTNNQTMDIVHASRSVLWVAPDHVFVYDRAASATAGRFKRFWLSLPAPPAIAGDRATMTMAGSGQQLFITKVAPAAAVMTAEPAETLPSQPAEGDTMVWRLRTEDPGRPQTIRFLHVLQGADAGAPADAVTPVAGISGASFAGAVAGDKAALFPVDLPVTVAALTYRTPLRARTHLVTGLVPGGSYGVAAQIAASEIVVTVTAGGTTHVADGGGVLVFDPLTCGAIQIAPATLPTATSGTAYGQTLSATAGIAPYTFAVTAGSLPAGLALAASGTLAGTPAATGIFSFTATATDAAGCTGAKAYVLVVNGAACGSIAISPATLPAGILGASYAQTLTASGGSAPYGFSILGGALPPGLALGAQGALAGTPSATGTFAFTAGATDAAGCTGLRAYALQVGSAADFLAGGGLGDPNPNRVKVHRPDGTATAVDFMAFGAAHWGVHVAGADPDLGTTGDILAGPGPGPILGPQVRGFRRDGTAISRINFYAYGTLKYGVLPDGVRIDGDGFDEILTGPGPGAVFGPHVRGFNQDGGTLAAMPKVSFYAYGTLKYGVHVSGGGVDGDAFEEILTGPGPGYVFGAQVRGFNYDGATVATIAKINFTAFTAGYGASVAAGDVEQDGFAEIAATLGAGPGLPSRFRGFDYDGAAIAGLPGFDTSPFPTFYGADVALGDLGATIGDELAAAPGPDPQANATVKAFAYDGAALRPTVTFASAGASYGATVGVALLAW